MIPVATGAGVRVPRRSSGKRIASGDFTSGRLTSVKPSTSWNATRRAAAASASGHEPSGELATGQRQIAIATNTTRPASEAPPHEARLPASARRPRIDEPPDVSCRRCDPGRRDDEHERVEVRVVVVVREPRDGAQERRRRERERGQRPQQRASEQDQRGPRTVAAATQRHAQQHDHDHRHGCGCHRRLRDDAGERPRERAERHDEHPRDEVPARPHAHPAAEVADRGPGCP